MITLSVFTRSKSRLHKCSRTPAVDVHHHGRRSIDDPIVYAELFRYACAFLVPLEGRSHRIVTKSSNWLGQDLTRDIEVLFDRQAFSFNKLDCGLVCRHFPQLFSKNVDFIIVGSKSLDKTAVVYEVHKSGSQYIPNVTFAISELKNIGSSVFSEQHRSSQI